MRAWIRIQAPFASFRSFQAGGYRASSPMIPPSTAWGLVLNLAHIETRGATCKTTTGIRTDAPVLRLALGFVKEPGICALTQQIYGCPTSHPEKEVRLRESYGRKYWIAPVRRELLIDLDVVVGVDAADDCIGERIQRGLAGTLSAPRYGLPFAGDNNFLLDRVDLLQSPPPARWYVVLGPTSPPLRGSCRLSVGVDRLDSSRTMTRVFAPSREPSEEPPPEAWVQTPEFAA